MTLNYSDIDIVF